FFPISREEYPDLKSFFDALNDEETRAKNFTATADHCEYWGMVPTEDLRIELKQIEEERIKSINVLGI
ncbi:MAG: hypothetical protein AAB895_03330, partial [Patescibacteria group bacterium]